jgi:hypothetical protein
MGILTIYPLSIAELDEKPNNIVDCLINSVVVKKTNKGGSKQELCEKILNGGYLEVQSKSS